MDRVVSNFEQALLRRDDVALEEYVPTPDHPHFEAILCELIRVDLELRWTRHCRRRLSDYQARHPQLFQNAVMLNLLAFEEFRQRVQSGEAVNPKEYEDAYGVYTASWPVQSAP
jgi:hypothetical protein